MDVTPMSYPDFDVLFTGDITKHRMNILADLKKHCGVSTGQKWGRDLTEAISRSKILLNIHQYSIPTPMEQVRLSYAMNNHCLIISEPSCDNPYPWLQTYIEDQIVPGVIRLLYDPAARKQVQQYQFHHFNQFRMKSILSQVLMNANIQID